MNSRGTNSNHIQTIAGRLPGEEYVPQNLTSWAKSLPRSRLPLKISKKGTLLRPKSTNIHFPLSPTLGSPNYSHWPHCIFCWEENEVVGLPVRAMLEKICTKYESHSPCETHNTEAGRHGEGYNRGRIRWILYLLVHNESGMEGATQGEVPYCFTCYSRFLL
jgi:hypothetical protein